LKDSSDSLAIEPPLDCKALKANPLTVNSQDLWLAKDNRFLNPKISYERILMAPPCRLINERKIRAAWPSELGSWHSILGYRRFSLKLKVERKDKALRRYQPLIENRLSFSLEGTE